MRLHRAGMHRYLPAQLPAIPMKHLFAPAHLFVPARLPCLQRKVDTMTRLMLDGGRGEAAAGGGGSGGKPRRENRRETWCPGAGGWVGGWMGGQAALAA